MVDSPAPAPLVSDPSLLSQIVEVSADAIFSEDLTGTIISWNAAAERVYGCAAVDMVGRSTRDLLPEQTTLQLQSVHSLALSGERVDRFDTWHLRPDGRRIAVSMTVSPLRDRDGSVVGLATSVQDVTDRVELTEELERLRAIQQRQNALLARSNRDLEQFAFVASHDLSEPLRAMTGFVQLLEKRYASTLDERGRGYVAHVVDGAARMRALIDDLLEYSRYLRVDLPTQRVDTNRAVQQVIDSLDLGASDIRIDDLPDVWCDEASLLAVLRNLLSNAVKFQAPDRTPVIVVSATLEGGTVMICVDDNGIGIAPEYRERVFRMFGRLHVREAYSGTGIGLAIVQQVAERSEGRAWVEDSDLGGSRFCVTLPGAPQEGVE